MPESRDRLQRPVDASAIFSLRRSGAPGVLVDVQERTLNLFDSPSTAARTTLNRGAGTAGPRGGGRVGRGGFRTPRMWSQRRRILHGSSSTGRENTPPSRVRGRGTIRPLPSWYPRTPLQDITDPVRATERRTRQGEVEGQPYRTPALNERAWLSQIQAQQIETPLPQGLNRFGFSSHVSSALLEHNTSIVTPRPTVEVKHIISPSVGKVPKILFSVTRQNAGEPEFLTPQKKLLDSIHTVEDVVKEELQKLKRTPSAKKADREKRVRTLMSMR